MKIACENVNVFKMDIAKVPYREKWLTSQGNLQLFQKVCQFVGPARFHKQNTQAACAIAQGLQKEHRSLGKKKDVRLMVILDQKIHCHSPPSRQDMLKEHAEIEEEQPDKIRISCQRTSAEKIYIRKPKFHSLQNGEMRQYLNPLLHTTKDRNSIIITS